MTAYKNGNVMRLLGSLFLISMLVIVLVVCKTKEKPEDAAEEKAEAKAEAQAIPDSEFFAVFGEAKENNSGIFNIETTPDGIIISYQFYPAVTEEADKEIGYDLAPKIKQFYDKHKNVDQVAFVIHIPESGEYGQLKKHVSFEVTREIVREMSWPEETFREEFFKAVKNVRYENE
jgi:hypothetical protein